MMDWFNSRYSDADLADILSDYSKSVTGYRNRQYGAGRCSIVRELEALDAFTANPANRLYLETQGWVFEDLSPFNTVNS
jgi:hypothetical protein